MPTLFRLLVTLGVIGGAITGSLYVLAEFFQPEPKEISKSLRNVTARPDEPPPQATSDADESVSGSVDSSDADAADAGGGADSAQ
ncbi:MAG: hypothetical protein ACR2J1_10105 [Methyloceanibacter sp.]|uniref:hypothetical protein n=1 Tax=Methyloceanibacter sp. TaxID=1965321 RepID=UPI003D9BA504